MKTTKEKIISTLIPLDSNEMLEINGGTWISWVVGYILSSLDNVPSKNMTKYGGEYLETINGRSSIM
jgi:hypothetical protein